MSKSGQPATKADTGGQRVPKSEGQNVGNDRKGAKKSTPATKAPAKKSSP